jgi:hypothetical protein
MLIAAALAVGLAAPALAQGTLRVAVGSTLNTLDPAKTTIGDEYIFVHLVFNGLTRIDPDLTIKPDLAVSWSVSDDLRVWTFKLREGVKFHNGKPFSAEDVVATMSRILDPATGSRARANIAMVEKVEAVEPLAVRFTLSIPYAGFQDIFGERQLRILAGRLSTTCACAKRWPRPSTRKRWLSLFCSVRARRRTAPFRPATPTSTLGWASTSRTLPKPRGCSRRPVCPTVSK